MQRHVFQFVDSDDLTKHDIEPMLVNAHKHVLHLLMTHSWSANYDERAVIIHRL